MPAPKPLDPGASPQHFFGAEFRRAREVAGIKQGEFAATVPCDTATVSRVEMGVLVPSDAFIDATRRAFPELDWLVRFFDASHRWHNGPIPRWLEAWLAAEGEATELRIWQPLIVPGLLQTPEYARALLLAGQTNTSDEAISAQVTARLARQSIFDKPDPPNVLVVLDQAVLHRLIGSPKIMSDQLAQVADLSARPFVSVQVIPASGGAHAGLAGSFMVASSPGHADVGHVDAVEDQTIDWSELVRKMSIAFERLRGDALPRNASRDLIQKVAEQWTT